MNDEAKPYVSRDLETGIPFDFDPLLGDPDLEQRIRSGEITREQADELLQAVARREVAEHGTDIDEGGTIAEGGFGSEQGMDAQSKKDGKISS